MAIASLREDLIADRYATLPVGPGLVYSFETQAGIPVDAGNPLTRDLSPFTIRIVVPDLVAENTGIDVNLIGRGGQSTDEFNTAANAVRSSFGISTITGGTGALSQLERIVSAGQIVSGATNTERAVFTDALTAADVARQVEILLNTPPLTLFVNPANMSVSYSTVQQFSNRTRWGFMFERWGEGQPAISFSGSTGAFMAGANPATAIPGQAETGSASGTQFASKRDSAAFQNFTSLFHFYRNNGYIFNTIEGSEAHHMVGGLAIDYDQFTYFGHIERFSYSYQEGSPHRIEWSMEFTVSFMYDHAERTTVVQPMRALGETQTNSADPGLGAGLSSGASSVDESLAHLPIDLLGF